MGTYLHGDGLEVEGVGYEVGVSDYSFALWRDGPVLVLDGRIYRMRDWGAHGLCLLILPDRALFRQAGRTVIYHPEIRRGELDWHANSDNEFPESTNGFSEVGKKSGGDGPSLVK